MERTRTRSQESDDQEKKLTPTQIRARFESKKHESSTPRTHGVKHQMTSRPRTAPPPGKASKTSLDEGDGTEQTLSPSNIRQKFESQHKGGGEVKRNFKVCAVETYFLLEQEIYIRPKLQ